MGGALDELSFVASTLVAAAMVPSTCLLDGNRDESGRDISGHAVFQESLSELLSASLDQMAAAASLINGRLPLDASEEAPHTLATCAAHPLLVVSVRQMLLFMLRVLQLVRVAAVKCL